MTIHANAETVKAAVRTLSEEVTVLEAGPLRPEGIRALSNRIRTFILNVPNCPEPLLDEARSCADMLNRLSRLKREAR